jgi:hypothetical protein
VKVMVIVDHYRFLVEVNHEKMDLVVKKIHNIMLHLPKDQLYYNQDNFLDLVDMLQSNLKKRKQSRFNRSRKFKK